MTYDPEFERWANMRHNYKGNASMSLKNFRNNIKIVLLNEQGTTVLAYNIYRCRVSEYQALPDLDAGANAVANSAMKLHNEG